GLGVLELSVGTSPRHGAFPALYEQEVDIQGGARHRVPPKSDLWSAANRSSRVGQSETWASRPPQREHALPLGWNGNASNLYNHAGPVWSWPGRSQGRFVMT